MMSAEYRPDIDGLRAIAVVPVILFHAHLAGFSGGYVGVDVFFVISGFLITGLITREIRSGTFSYVDFWERRARRLLPPLILVTLLTLLGGWFVLLPTEYKALGQSVVSTSVFASNIYFWLKAGYFTAPQDMIPLLHTWSLAVEEQYYLLFPALLLAVARWSDQGFRRAVVFVGVASFAWGVWLIERNPDSAYYLLPSRAWELMLGAWLALSTYRIVHRVQANLLAFVGLLLILVPVFNYTETTSFPGWAATAPCAGTAMLILSGQTTGGLSHRLLTLRPMVAVGRLSYSLYLWHWPALVLGAAIFDRFIPELTAAQVALILFATVAGAWLSQVLVENPIRYRKVLASRATILTASFVALSALASGGLYLHVSQGMPSRLPASVLQLAAVAAQGTCATPALTLETLRVENLCRFGATPGQAKAVVVLFGDSHASHLIDGLHEAARSENATVWLISRGGCPPLPAIEDLATRYAPDCANWNRKAMTLLPELQADAIIVAGHWNAWRPGHAQGAAFDPVRLQIGLEALFAELKAMHLKSIVVLNVPSPGAHFHPSRHATAIWHGGHPRPGMPRAAYLASNAWFQDLLQSTSTHPDHVVRHEDTFCSIDGFCDAIMNGRSLYTDNNHLSAAGQALLVPELQKALRAVLPAATREHLSEDQLRAPTEGS